MTIDFVSVNISSLVGDDLECLHLTRGDNKEPFTKSEIKDEKSKVYMIIHKFIGV